MRIQTPTSATTRSRAIQELRSQIAEMKNRIDRNYLEIQVETGLLASELYEHIASFGFKDRCLIRCRDNVGGVHRDFYAIIRSVSKRQGKGPVFECKAVNPSGDRNDPLGRVTRDSDMGNVTIDPYVSDVENLGGYLGNAADTIFTRSFG